MPLAAFHDVVFPVSIALGASGGPERRTEIVTLGSGRETRNARWLHARRRYDAGTGMKSLADLAAVVAFFEERRGRLCGFRWRDALDDRSCLPGAMPAATDQPLGTGTGSLAVFQLQKTYGSGVTAYVRPVVKPVAGSVRVAVAGTEMTVGTDVSVDAATGLVTFAPGHVPAAGATVTAGFLFHVPVRFDTDALKVDLSAFAAGEVPHIAIVEIAP